MAKYAAKGVIVKFGLTATPTTTFPQLKTTGLDGGERQMINTTTHDDTVTFSYISAALRDTRGLPMEFLYDPSNATHEILRAAADAGTLVYATLVLPDAGSAQFAMSGYLTSFTIAGMDSETGLLMASSAFKATGADTFTA